ncbi:hypothetical protein OF113_12545 [Ectopseudomonas chengduensis]|nr:hypothetical protein [Pseudomonas chengduensis]UZT80829.1 hypothetical protein OF113_12545 [Pseudomonas chengduensis]
MDINIEKITGQNGERWLVTAGLIQLHFNDLEAALDFTSRLKTRIEAPHELPAEAFSVLVERAESALA